jgi:gas vesicle protein GvpK
MTAGKVLVEPPDDRAFPEQRSLDDALSRRINADPEGVEKGLAQLVLTVVELLRQLMERQALHRVELGTLSEDEIERLGQTFMALARRMDELKEQFGLEDKDLNLDLGPLGTLL